MTNLKTLLIFFLTASLIIFLGFDFLKPAFDIGLSPEDREFILRYKLLGPNPLAKILQVWSERGAYSTIPIYYIGIIQSIAGFNYQLIQFYGFSFRVLAILSIFPLVTLVFRNIWLAVLTTIIFGFSYATTGALETGVEPSEYLGFFMMNIFLIAYYFLNTKYLLQAKWLILTSSLLFIAVMTSAMRVYPILFLIPFIEVFLYFLNGKKYKFKYLFFKISVLYSPFFILTFFSTFSASGHFSLQVISSKVIIGNWQLMLTPLQGLGHIIPLNKYYGSLGTLDLSNFGSYMTFLLGGPLIIFGSASLVLSWIGAKKKLPFFMRLFGLNFALEIFTYWLSQHRLTVPLALRLNFDPQRLYPVFFGLFIFSVMINFLICWLKESRKNNLLLTFWLGPLTALFFIVMTFIFANLDLSFGGAQDHYLLIPTMGISLSVGAILLVLYAKLSAIRLKFIGRLTIVSLIVLLYFLNRELTHEYFENANFNGRAAVGQELLQGKIRGIFKNLDYSKPTLVYFDTSEIAEGKSPFYSEGLFSPFPFIMYTQEEEVISGCIGIIYENKEMNKLKKSLKVIGKDRVIIHQTACIENNRINVRDIFYKAENLIALKIIGGDFVDIKDQVLKELNFE